MTFKELLAIIIVAIAVLAGFAYLSIQSMKQRCTSLSEKLGSETKYNYGDCFIKNTYGWFKI